MEIFKTLFNANIWMVLAGIWQLLCGIEMKENMGNKFAIWFNIIGGLWIIFWAILIIILDFMK